MFRVDVEITEGLTYVIVVNVEQFINVPLPIFVIDDGINIDVKCVQFSKQKFPIDVQIEPMSTLAKYPPLVLHTMMMLKLCHLMLMLYYQNNKKLY